MSTEKSDKSGKSARIIGVLEGAILAGILGILGVLIGVVQIGQTNQDMQEGSIIDGTIVAIQKAQLEALEELATLQAATNSKNPDINATIVAERASQLEREIETLELTKVAYNATIAAEEKPQPENEIEILEPTESIPVLNLDSIPGATISYETDFSNMVDFFGNWGQYGSVNIIEDSLVVDGKSAGSQHEVALREGEGILVLFKCSSGADTNIVLFSENHDRYIGIKPGSALMVSLGYNDDWLGGQQLDGSLPFLVDTWYYALVEIRDGGQFYLKVWHEDTPNLYREKLLSMGDQWDDILWSGRITTNQFNMGQIEVESYYELQFND